MLPMDDLDLDSPGGRLKWAREQAGFDKAVDFAKRHGLNPTSYRAYENNQNGFSRKAHDFADKLSVTARWLLEGGDLEQSVEEPGALSGQARQMGLALIPELELGYSMGGGSIFADYHQKGFVPFQRDWLRGFMRGTFADMFVARGEGDSMTPTLLDGDIVLIDTAQKAIDRQDRIWAISYGDLGMIKRVRRMPNGVYRIMSDNPVVEPIEVADDEMHVVGRVVWIGRTM
jgi:phage repressor protein C with HTH and peptisase S24 domain